MRIGPDVLLAPEQMVVVGSDADDTRAIARAAVANPYLRLRNYRANLERLGFTAADMADDGSDRLIDALVAHGDADHVASRLRAHLDAGADHVAVQVLPAAEDPLPALRAVAAALGL